MRIGAISNNSSFSKNKVKSYNNQDIKFKSLYKTDVFILSNNKNITNDSNIYDSPNVKMKKLNIENNNNNFSFKGRNEALKHVERYTIAALKGAPSIKYPIGSINSVIMLESMLANDIAKEYNFKDFNLKKMSLNIVNSPKAKQNDSSLENELASIAFEGISNEFNINDLTDKSQINKSISKYRACELIGLFGENCINVCENWSKSKIGTSLTTDDIKKYDASVKEGIIPEYSSSKVYDSDDDIYVDPTYGYKASYWDSEAYHKYVEDWNELYESGQIGHGWTPPPPPMYYTSNGPSHAPEGKKAKKDNKPVDDYGYTEDFYRSEAYHKYVEDWSELYESGQIGHGWTPPPPSNFGHIHY